MKKIKIMEKVINPILVIIAQVAFFLIVTLQIINYLSIFSPLLPSYLISLLKAIVSVALFVVIVYIFLTSELYQKRKKKKPTTDSIAKPEGETDLKHFSLVTYVIFSVVTIAIPIYYNAVIQIKSLCDGLVTETKENPTTTSTKETDAEKAKKELESTLSKKCIKFYKDYNNLIKDEEKN